MLPVVAGLFANGIRFLPPLGITDDQLHEGLAAVEAALTEVEYALRPAERLDRRQAAGAS